MHDFTADQVKSQHDDCGFKTFQTIWITQFRRDGAYSIPTEMEVGHDGSSPSENTQVITVRLYFILLMCGKEYGIILHKENRANKVQYKSNLNVQHQQSANNVKFVIFLRIGAVVYAVMLYTYTSKRSVSYPLSRRKGSIKCTYIPSIYTILYFK